MLECVREARRGVSPKRAQLASIEQANDVDAKVTLEPADVRICAVKHFLL